MHYRKIHESDNKGIAAVIRAVLKEHGVDKPGTVFTDPTTDELFDLFQTENAQYWVVENAGQIIGGAGIFPTKGLPSDCVELVKLYLHKSLRGKGVGKHLIQMCIDEAQEYGFSSVYLETMPELSNAIGLYEKMGFEKLDKRYGDSGHFACDLWMLKKIDV